jgi:hypothetical protein
MFLKYWNFVTGHRPYSYMFEQVLELALGAPKLDCLMTELLNLSETAPSDQH